MIDYSIQLEFGLDPDRKEAFENFDRSCEIVYEQD